MTPTYLHKWLSMRCYRLERAQRALSATAALTLAMLTGCSVAERVESPENWPLEQGTWQLFEEDGQLVYATGGRAAASVATLVAEVRADYLAITSEAPIEVLPIAYAAGDDPPIDDFETRWVELLMGTEQYLEALRGAKEGESNESAFANLAPIPNASGFEADAPEFERFRGMLDQHMPLESFVSIAPIFFTPERAGLTPALDTPWTCIPLIASPARRADALSEMISAGMRAEGISRWKRALVAPILALVRGKMETMLENITRCSLFEVQLLSRTPRFSAEEQRAYLAAYKEKIGFHGRPDFSDVRAKAEELDAKYPNIDPPFVETGTATAPALAD